VQRGSTSTTSHCTHSEITLLLNIVVPCRSPIEPPLGFHFKFVLVVCVVWCGVVWCGVVWCGVVWCGVVWCGMNAYINRIIDQTVLDFEYFGHVIGFSLLLICFVDEETQIFPDLYKVFVIGMRFVRITQQFLFLDFWEESGWNEYSQ